VIQHVSPSKRLHVITARPDVAVAGLCTKLSEKHCMTSDPTYYTVFIRALQSPLHSTFTSSSILFARGRGLAVANTLPVVKALHAILSNRPI